VVHELTASEPALCRSVSVEKPATSALRRSRSSSTETRYSAPTTLGHNAVSVSGPPSTHDTLVAARALLTRHHAYSEMELMEYLKRCYPEIPADYRRPLVLGAVAGAQKAAHSHYAFEHNRHSPEEERRRLAANWASQLSFWNMGLGECARRPGNEEQPYDPPDDFVQPDDFTQPQVPAALSDRDLPV